MSIILAMCLFSLSMSISPGPVNLITLSTGMNYGFNRALPFVSGATVGFTLLLIATGLGFNWITEILPGLIQWLKYAGTLFLCYMGYRIATADSTELSVVEEARPSFIQGALLQWLNPKAWIASVSGISVFSLSGSLPVLLMFSGLYFVICYLSIASWAWAGDRVSDYLDAGLYLKWINLVMGGVLILVALYLSIFMPLEVV